MSNPNLVTCTPSKKNLDYSVENEVYTSFVFNPPAMDTSKRPKLDIAVALDVSGSMDGPKIEAAKASLLKLIEHLTDQDSLAIVTFASHVEVILPVSFMTTKNRSAALAKVSQIHANGGTNLSGGLLQALTLLKERQVGKDTVRRCMMFTDGQANEGIKNPAEIIAAVKEFRSGIGISTFGYGNDHDPELLASLAMDGGFYYIQQADTILSAFGTELGGLIATYAQNVELRVEPVEGVEIAEVLNDVTVSADGKAAIVRCDDLLAEQPYTVVLRLKIDKRNVQGKPHPRETALLHTRVKFFNVSEKKLVEETLATKVKFVVPGAEDKEHDKAVMNAVAFQKSIKAQTQALMFAQAGDLGGSRAVLDSAVLFARSVGTVEANLIADVGTGLMEEAYADVLTYERGGHHMGSSTRKAMSRGRDYSSDLKVGGIQISEVYGSVAQQKMSENFAKPKNPQDLVKIQTVNSIPSGVPISPKGEEGSSGFTKSRTRQ